MNDFNNYYQTAAINFDKYRLDDDSEIESHTSWFINNLNPKNIKLLDIGCGTGRYGLSFYNKGMTVLGVDKSPDQILIASKRIPTICSEVFQAEFPNQSYDAVCLIMVIHQFKPLELPTLFKKIAHALKPEGRLWIKTCSHKDLSKRPFNDEFPSALKINIERYPSIECLVELAIKYGFECSRQESICNEFNLSGNEILQRFKGKHNSTLYLMSEGDVAAGLSLLETKYDKHKDYSFTHSHTLLEFKKLNN
ncbi:bifunctional 2-polyprenyl-6-hydroxyphenol methylase/3-demethylubiquinol 3-O-methyltransferase UbiG [Methylophilus sp. 14]|uniref:class I SAM-dependent methyltransferase n=1 Tax=Methylophilus sp. 14 TaxID=2781019 RepID=UPI00188DCB74|nr:class I SAM-dependent methyltransferase [Methylophilus sp. 14]MBF4987673.1 class I SAM-dependent methyltransferase [Methylophilus sp. 14]